MLFATLAWVSAARAQTHVFELEWSAPSACMSKARARAAIEELIAGGAPSDGITSEISVQIEGNEQDGYLAELEIEHGDEEGERELRGARCEDVASAATLVIAMVIDESAAERLANQPDPQPEAREEEPSDALRFSLGLHLLGDAGSLPHAGLGAGLSLGAHFTRLRLELTALGFLPQRVERGPSATSSIQIALAAGLLRACVAMVELLDATLALEGCAAGELGVSSGSAEGISNGATNRALWGAGFVGIGARQALAQAFQLGVLLELGLPILRPAYEIGGFGPVFRADPLLGRLSLEARWLFP